jgi:hypothetical protein
MMTHRTTGYVAGITMALSIAVFIAGCSPDARQGMSEAGAKVGSATEKSAQATEDAAKKTGQDIKVGAENAGEAVKGAFRMRRTLPKKAHAWRVKRSAVSVTNWS